MKNKLFALIAAICLCCLCSFSCSSDWRCGFTSYAENEHEPFYTVTDYNNVLGIDLNDYYYFIWYGYNQGDVSFLLYYDKDNVTSTGYTTINDVETYVLTYNGEISQNTAWTFYGYDNNNPIEYNGAAHPRLEITGLGTEDNVTIKQCDISGNVLDSTATWTNYGYLTNFPNISTAGSLEFSVTPDLTGEITRNLTQNGQYYTIDTFAVTVDNTTSDNYMYSWAIVPHGQSYYPYYSSPNYHDYVKNVDEKKFYSSSPTYLYFTDEWVYIPAAGSSYNLVLTPSSWHSIPADGHIDNMVQFDQLNLIPNSQYDILCFGVKLDSGSNATYLDTYYYNNSFAVDFVTDTQLYYSSTFSVTDPANFNNDSRGFGAYAWNNDQLYSNTDWSMRTYGYKDENGNTVIQENKTTDFNLSAHPINGFNYQAGKSNNFDSLSSSVDNFFTFCTRVFGFFPADCLTILKLGLAALVAVALFKVVTHG